MTFYDPDDPNIVYTTEVNGEHNKGHYIWIDYTTPLTKWFRIDAFMNLYWSQREIDGDRQASYSAGGRSRLLRIILQPITTMEIWVSGSAELPYKKLETRQNGSFGLSAGISQSFCKNKLILSLNVNAIYYDKLKLTTERLDKTYYSVLKQPRGRRSTRVVFSIVYRFNRNAKKSVSTVQTLQRPGEILK